MHATCSTPTEFVHLPESFVNVVRKLHERQSTLCFYNSTREFKILLRTVPESQETMKHLELQCIILAEPEDSSDDSDSDDGTTPHKIRKILDMDFEGYWDEDDDECYVAESVQLNVPLESTAVSTKEAIAFINNLYLTKVCPCCQYLVRPPDDLCLACELSGTHADLQQDMCPICHDPAYKMHRTLQSCCRQSMHKKCLQTWASHRRRKGEDVTCPVCRSIS